MNNDFSSIEHLVEFGMSMAVAQQMISTMNHAIGNMAVPGAGAPIVNHKEYYVVIDNAQAGPFTEEQFAQLIADGRVNGSTLMWHRGMTAWKCVQDVPEANKWVVLNGGVAK